MVVLFVVLLSPVFQWLNGPVAVPDVMATIKLPGEVSIFHLTTLSFCSISLCRNLLIVAFTVVASPIVVVLWSKM